MSIIPTKPYIEATDSKLLYRLELDHRPTVDDYINKVGFEGFLEELKKHSWMDANGTMLRPFHVFHKLRSFSNERAVEWTAQLNRSEGE